MTTPPAFTPAARMCLITALMGAVFGFTVGVMVYSTSVRECQNALVEAIKR